MGELIAAFDWSSTPLGPIAAWPVSLRSAVSLLVRSPVPMVLLWGVEGVLIYNDAYSVFAGARHPTLLGRKVLDAGSPESADFNANVLKVGLAGGALSYKDQELILRRAGRPEPVWMDLDYSPVPDDEGRPAGVIAIVNETTERVAADRRRAAAEAATRQEAARLRLVIEAARDYAILTTDPEGLVTSWSPGAEAIFGWAPGEIVGHPMAAIFTPEDRAAGLDVRERRTAAACGFANDERWHVRKDGGRVFMNGSVHPLPVDGDGQPQGFLKIARDETQRRWNDEALRRLNTDLERQVRQRTQARGAIWQLSPDLLGALNAEGYFETSNPAWKTVLGWSEEEVARTSMFELMHPDDVPASRDSFDLTQIGEPVIRFPNRYRCKDGGYRWISWVGVPEDGLVYCSGRDITDERAAATERDRIFEISRDLFAVATFDGQLKSINPAWSAALGTPEAEILARPFTDTIHPDDRAATAEVFATLRRGQPVHQFHIRLLKSDGEPILFAWSSVPDASLDSGLFYTVGRDITEETAAAAELRDVQAALRQSQKMEAVGQLTGGIAHDFNNLLAGIAGSLELMQKRIADQRLEGFDRHLGIAQGSAQRAAALTQRLLAFSRRQTLDPKALDVNRLIGGVEDLIRRTVGPAVEVAIVGAIGLWVIKVDGSQLENALLNLAINARDAMPDGGRITIETANTQLDDRAAKERDLPPGQYISLCVTDTGAGMKPEVIERAFDPFYTTKPLGQGTGLGLSMIHGFVRQSGGQVHIDSELGHGTTLCLHFPRFMGEAESQESKGADHALEPGHGETVLVIDDEAPIRMLIRDVLEAAGYRVLEAPDGPAGLKILQSDSRIDLLITDVGLPGGFNGRQVADAARQTRPELKVLFVTGYAETAVVGDGQLDAGMQVITKPFAMTALALRVREIIEA